MQPRQQQEARVMVLLGIIRQLMATREAKLFAGKALSPSQFALLSHFTHRPEHSWTVSQLAEVMEMNQPGITKIVSVLLDKKLIEAKPDAADKRKKHLKITAYGLSQCREMINSLMPDVSHIFSEWSNAELNQLQEGMDKLMLWLDEHRDDIKSR